MCCKFMCCMASLVIRPVGGSCALASAISLPPSTATRQRLRHFRRTSDLARRQARGHPTIGHCRPAAGSAITARPGSSDRSRAVAWPRRDDRRLRGPDHSQGRSADGGQRAVSSAAAGRDTTPSRPSGPRQLPGAPGASGRRGRGRSAGSRGLERSLRRGQSNARRDR